MQAITKQETVQAIKKLENQFKATFMAYTSEKDQSKRQAAHEKLERESSHGPLKKANNIVSTMHSYVPPETDIDTFI